MSKKFIKITEKYLDAVGLNDPTLVGETLQRVACDGECNISEMSGEILGKISALTVDADGDLILPGGVKTDRYNKNSIVLFNHDLNMPIGRSDIIAIESDGVYSRFKLSSIEEAQKIYTLLKEKVLNTLSIGFIPINAVMKGSREYDYL